MRRKDKEITEEKIIHEILDKAKICRLGLSQKDMPYVIPVCFVYKENTLYIHSAKEGMKIDIIRQNNNVCFEVDTNIELINSDQPCDNSMKYQSVIGFGKAFFIESFQEKKQALDILMNKYIGKGNFEYLEKAVNNICIIKISIDSITGKQSI